MGRVLSAPFRYPRKRPAAARPRSILVVEMWHLGDVVLTTPLLQALRAAYPEARISILGKPHAEVLLRGTGLADDFIAFDFPWTAFTGKYRLTRYHPLRILSLVRRLRAAKFDLVIDARMDLRSNIVTFLSGARRRVGYDYGGGSYLLTDAVPANPEKNHKVEDWLALLEPLGIARASWSPRLSVTAEERTVAARFLEQAGIDRARPVVGLHPGANQPVRKWPLERFDAVAEAALSAGAQVVLFTEPGGYGEQISARPGVTRVEKPLREFLAILEQCDLLVCNDSGPMHIAAALGVGVVAVFGPQRPEWYGPWGEGHRLVLEQEMECRPCFDNCMFAEPFCITRIGPERVVAETVSAIESIRRRRAARLPERGNLAKLDG